MSLMIIFYAVLSFLQKSVDFNYIYLFQYFIDKFYKSDGSMTSGGQRITEISSFLKLLWEYPAGLGGQVNIHEPIGNTGIVVAGLSVGTFKSILKVGLIGGLGYLFVIISLLAMVFQVFKQFKHTDPMVFALADSVFSMLLMGLQRADIFSIYVAIFMSAFFVRIYLSKFKHKKITKKVYLFYES
jgi:ABC-type multidrug transport system fused ATPase/permease subunit